MTLDQSRWFWLCLRAWLFRSFFIFSGPLLICIIILIVHVVQQPGSYDLFRVSIMASIVRATTPFHVSDKN